MIQRFETGKRMSQCVVHGNTVYLAGQVGANTRFGTVEAQTKDICAAIDRLLAQAGTDKTKMLSALVWVTDMRQFDEMNKVWDAWVPEGCAPCRAATEARLAAPGYDVEIMVVAAKD